LKRSQSSKSKLKRDRSRDISKDKDPKRSRSKTPILKKDFAYAKNIGIINKDKPHVMKDKLMNSQNLIKAIGDINKKIKSNLNKNLMSNTVSLSTH